MDIIELSDNKYKRLKEYKFPEILYSISASSKTGTLHLKNWPAEKKIYIKKGKIIFASSNLEEDCLGINLLEKGRITVVQYYESIRLLEKRGKRHGSILIDLGFITKKDLGNAIKEQVEEMVLSIFKWEDGYFYFEETPFTIDEPIRLNTDTITLIYKGIRSMDSFPQIRNALPFTTILTKSQSFDKVFRKLKFSPPEKKILKLIDGTNTVLDILTSAEGDDFDALKLLYILNSVRALSSVGHIDVEKEVLSATSDIDGSDASYYFNLAVSLINSSQLDEAEDALTKAIKIEPFNDNYHAELGMLYIKQGFPKKAGKTLEFALRINPHNERARTVLSEIKNLIDL